MIAPCTIESTVSYKWYDYNHMKVIIVVGDLIMEDSYSVFLYGIELSYNGLFELINKHV